ncbi:MAG: radical SAM/SPASM domain-containing protein [Pseudomonadota bacterium]|nr:radical SAM/SPASM domain-containing protein [Pseudomonadota bacterium]
MTIDRDPYIPINKGQFTLETKEREKQFEKNRGYGVADEYKENRRLWTDCAKKQLVSDYPLHVDLELASICNLKCPMCYTISPEFKKKVNAKLMDYELFTNLIDECAMGGVYSIRLSFRGESFLHKRILDCVRYAKNKGIKEVSTLTNGVRLDEDMFEKLMEAGIDWITISFDGLGKTYEQIRSPAKYERAVEKIANYSKIKEKAGRVKPIIKIQSILPAIEDDPKSFYDVFAPISDMVSANPLIDFMASTKNSPKIENFSCPQIYQRLVIGADGLCMMCANDEEGQVIVGDANKQTIHEIWHGKEFSRVRAIHRQCAGTDKLNPCSECYLPLKTKESNVKIGGRSVIAEKYVSGTEKVTQLQTPEKFKRKDLQV